VHEDLYVAFYADVRHRIYGLLGRGSASFHGTDDAQPIGAHASFYSTGAPTTWLAPVLLGSLGNLRSCAFFPKDDYTRRSFYVCCHIVSWDGSDCLGSCRGRYDAVHELDC
jgi:hypothetical protein